MTSDPTTFACVMCAFRAFSKVEKLYEKNMCQPQPSTESTSHECVNTRTCVVREKSRPLVKSRVNEPGVETYTFSTVPYVKRRLNKPGLQTYIFITVRVHA